MCPKHSKVKVKVKEGSIYCETCLLNWRKLYNKYSKEWDDIIIQRKQNKCSKCGYKKCITVIDLHHNNPKDKEFNIKVLKNLKFKPKYLKEILKCISLCANCHRELHFKDGIPNRK